MSLKINVLPVVGDHLRTLRNERTGKTSPLEVFIQYGLPVVVGVALAKIGFAPESFTNVIAALAILFGFFFALAVFIFQLRLQIASSPEPDEHRPSLQLDRRVPRLIDELFTNASYAVLASALATIAVVIADTIDLSFFGVVLVVAVSLHVLLLVLMCLKRLNAAYGFLKSSPRQYLARH